MSRPLTVVQCESEATFWWHVQGGNRQIMATSEVYTRRASAVRAARAFIKQIAPVPVTFRYWVRVGNGSDRRLATELVRHGSAS